MKVIPTIVFAQCSGCGPVRVEATKVTLTHRQEPEQSSYSFICPVCGRHVAITADEEHVIMLIAAGARINSWLLPDSAIDQESAVA